MKRVPPITPGNESIYILELSQGRVYVGQSSDMRRRIHQHMSGRGSAFTKEFPPTGVLLPRLGCVTGSAEAAERDETIRYMFLRGIQLVRGWKYTRVCMPPEEIQDAEENIREIFNLCRRCGHAGHFITQCRASLDRLGRPCKGSV
jgi:predicted GIY-YIG superfamily endonuclease